MFKIENNKIKVIQGDTGIIDLKLNGETLKTGDKVYFTVKEDYDTTVLLQKVITTFVDGGAKIQFSKADTNIAIGSYLYDIQVSFADGRVDTVVAPSRFVVLGGITND